MRLTPLVALSALVLAASGAPATAAPAGRSLLPCKVFRTALGGTVVGLNATDLNNDSPHGCTYLGDAPWMASLTLDDTVTTAGGPRGYARLFCKPQVAKNSGVWLTKRQAGADLACAVQAKDTVKRTTHAFFAKGRWYGEVFIQTPPSGGGFAYIAFLVKRVTAALPR